ncbi:MAG: TetR/AcrR family transcriptional regulator [Xanthobacteraceae bacterium]
MNVQAKPDDTRARIIETADTLFRRLGFAKTAVADIAAELSMSPANVYRFFASKNAIVEAICRRHLGIIEDEAWSVARSRAPAATRLERLFLEILAYHKRNFLSDQRVLDIVMVAIEQNWDTIHAHKDVVRTVTELILRDGIEAGEFDPVDPRDTAELIMRSLVCFTHPVLIGECLEEGQDVEAEAHKTIRFLLRAISPRG